MNDKGAKFKDIKENCQFIRSVEIQCLYLNGLRSNDDESARPQSALPFSSGGEKKREKKVP